MSHLICPECGCPVTGTEGHCPECGVPFTQPSDRQKPGPTAVNQTTEPNPSPAPSAQSNQATSNRPAEKDWANYVYECGVIAWNVIRHRFANVSGRASRREFWSVNIIGWFSLVTLLSLFGLLSSLTLLIAWIDYSFFFIYEIFSIVIMGMITFLVIAYIVLLTCTAIRRMHDINRCGWWCICPVVGFFFLLKRSDEDTNNYGEPTPAKDLIC